MRTGTTTSAQNGDGGARRAGPAAIRPLLIPAARPDVPPPAEPHALARRLYGARRIRAKAFPQDADIFHEPAWDILLDLYIACKEQRSVSVTSTCIAANVPTTTGLRWIATLQQHGLAERIDDPCDRRRSYVRISAKGLEGMEKYLAWL